MNEILTAVITGAVSLIVCLITNRAQYVKTVAVLECKIDELSRRVEKHNSVVERTYELERVTARIDERQRTANHRIDGLENLSNKLK